MPVRRAIPALGPRSVFGVAGGIAITLALAAGAAFAPAPARAAATDTVFVWTVDPYQSDPAYLARNYGCGVFDTRRGRAMVVGGGEIVSHPGAYLYAHSATTVVRAAGDAAWTAYDSSAPATALVDAACAVYDSLNDAVWLFGGRHNANSGTNYGWTAHVVGDLSRFDVAGHAWSLVAPLGPAPQPRTGASLVLDPVRHRLWLFGGADSLGVALNDLWSMDLAAPGAWNRVTNAGTGPSARAQHLAVYDPGADRMIVTGGYGDAGAVSDTWTLAFAGSPSWQPLATTGTPAPARLVGAFDVARGRVLAGGNGDGAIYALDVASGEWSAHTPFGTGVFDNGSAAILDPASDVLISAWSGTAVVAGGAGFTPPTGFLHLGHLQPTVHLDASLVDARYVHGATELIWDLQFDHPLWSPAVLEFVSLAGDTTSHATTFPAAAGETSIGLYDVSIAGDTLAMHFRWFDGTQQQVTAGVPIRFPPAPLVLHVTPDSLWTTGSDLHVWFRVPDDSAQYLVDQVLERRVDGGAWNFRERGFPRADSIWAFDEIGVLPFKKYEYRIAWTGPDGVNRASAPYGMTILGEPVLTGAQIAPDSVRIQWATKPGIDEFGRVRVRRPASASAWSDTIDVRTDAGGVMAIRDMLVGPDTDYAYELEWFDGAAWQGTAELVFHTPDGGTDSTAVDVASGLWVGASQPNPALASAGFSVPVDVSGSGPTRIDAYDPSGRLRRSWTWNAPPGSAMLRLDTSGLGTGVYLLRAEHLGVVRTSRVSLLR